MTTTVQLISSVTVLAYLSFQAQGSNEGAHLLPGPGEAATPQTASAALRYALPLTKRPGLLSGNLQSAIMLRGGACTHSCAPPCADCLHVRGSAERPGAKFSASRRLQPVSIASAFNISMPPDLRAQACKRLVVERGTLVLHVLASTWTGQLPLSTQSALVRYTMPCAVLLPIAVLESDEASSWTAVPARRVQEILVAASASVERGADLILQPTGTDTNATTCPQHTVITHSSTAGSVLAAARALGILLASGCSSAVLHGGMHAWATQGGALWPILAAPQVRVNGLDVQVGPGVAPRRGSRVLTWPLLRHNQLPTMVAGGAVLVDVRSFEEFQGLASGYSYMASAPALPGAVWGGGGGDAVGAQDTLPMYWDAAGYLWSPRALCKWWRIRGQQPSSGRAVILYCGTAWRASAVWLALLRCFPVDSRHVWVLDGGVHAM